LSWVGVVRSSVVERGMWKDVVVLVAEEVVVRTGDEVLWWQNIQQDISQNCLEFKANNERQTL